jgi:preprotein translocase subunit SecG
MSILITLLLIVLVISSLLLIGVILLQRSKSEGLGLAFGASTGESLFGARAGNVLTKITVILGIVFMASALLLGVLYAKKDQPLMDQVTTNLVESERASEEAGE